MEEVAYKLDLPSDSKIHPVFHGSCLKLKLGQQISPLPTLPPLDETGQIIPEPVAVLQTRTKSLRSRSITEVLVQWLGTTPEDATWESLHLLKLKFPHLVGKFLNGVGYVKTPSHWIDCN